jgi:hypothetical protein
MSTDSEPKPTTASWVMVVLAWTVVGIPLAWGIFITFKKASVLFR